MRSLEIVFKGRTSIKVYGENPFMIWFNEKGLSPLLLASSVSKSYSWIDALSLWIACKNL